jgi:hypothetical protein
MYQVMLVNMLNNLLTTRLQKLDLCAIVGSRHWQVWEPDNIIYIYSARRKKSIAYGFFASKQINNAVIGNTEVNYLRKLFVPDIEQCARNCNIQGKTPYQSEFLLNRSELWLNR